MLTVKDVAKKLGISVNAVRIRVGKGKLPNPDKRQGNEFYWHEETLAAAFDKDLESFGKLNQSVGRTLQESVHDSAVANTPKSGHFSW